MTLNDRSEKKNQSIVFVSNTEEGDEGSEMDFAVEFS
jgi:hypothetical protein